MSDRRVGFFLMAALLALAITPVAPPKLRWVGQVLAVTYVVLAVLVALDAHGRRR